MRLTAFVLTLPLAAANLPRIERLLESAPNALIGVQVVEPKTGKPLYARNAERLLVPASNMKLFTTALALLRLGPDHRFETRVMLEPSGDLVLLGSGDPSLSGRLFPYQKDAPAGPPLAAIEDLADQIVASGVHRVDGDVVGDDTRFPWAPYPPGWTLDDALHEYGAPVSALTVNDNALRLLVLPGARPGDAARLELSPALEYFAIDNRARTTTASQPRIRVSRPAGSRQLLLWGGIPEGHSGVVETLAIDDPALFAAHALADALTRRGVVIAGQPAARHRLAHEDAPEPSGTLVASRTSPPLVELLRVIDKVSQNLHAALVLNEVGRVTRHTGTREAGLEEMDALLAEAGISKDDCRFEDAAGLARGALVTPRALTRLLVHMYRSTQRDTWTSLLPVGGEDGTLRRRFGGVEEARAIQAKTGSLARALTLSGYAQSRTHGPLAFAILVNNFAAPASEVRRWIDTMALALLE